MIEEVKMIVTKDYAASTTFSAWSCYQKVSVITVENGKINPDLPTTFLTHLSNPQTVPDAVAMVLDSSVTCSNHARRFNNN